MIAAPDETVAPLASALVRAGRAGSGQRIALSNGAASRSVIPLVDRRAFVGTLAGGFLAAPLAAQAQQAGKVYRVGILSPGGVPDPSVATAPNLVPVALRELGYVDGRNLVVERRFADGRIDRLPQLARELVLLQMDLIFAAGEPAVQAAKDTTATVPIVMIFGGGGEPLTARREHHRGDNCRRDRARGQTVGVDHGSGAGGRANRGPRHRRTRQ